MVKTEAEIREMSSMMKEMFNNKEHRFPWVSYQCFTALDWVLGEDEGGIPVGRIREYMDFKNSKRKTKK